jgi:hypothetical protein
MRRQAALLDGVRDTLIDTYATRATVDRAEIGAMMAAETWLNAADAIAKGADTQAFNDLIMQRMQSGATDTTTLAGVGATKSEARKYSFLRAIQAQIPGANVDVHTVRISTATEEHGGRELLPPRYHADSQLTATVKAGRNTIDFALTTP